MIARKGKARLDSGAESTTCALLAERKGNEVQGNNWNTCQVSGFAISKDNASEQANLPVHQHSLLVRGTSEV